MKARIEAAALSQNITLLAERVEDLFKQVSCRQEQRILIALAGVPGSGKSTVSTALMKTLDQKGVGNVVLIPMDGFHFPKKTLATFPCPRTAFRRRGAPFTFDAAALVEAVVKLKNSAVTRIDDPQLGLWLPNFEHAAQDPIENDIYVPSSTKVVIVEGNYLLLDESPWNKAAMMFDEKWFVEASREVAKSRLVERHVFAGIEKTRESAIARVEGNDIPNGDLIRSKLVLPDVIIVN